MTARSSKRPARSRRRARDGTVSLDVRLERETVWLTQKQMAELFATERSVITKHLRNIFASGELEQDSVCAFFAHTAEDGKTYQTAFYNLDAAISVGYRVNSKRGTQFRTWATRVLRDHILKGYSVNAKRLAELEQTIRLVARVADARALKGDEAAALFLWFLEKNRALYDAGGERRIAEETLVALTLLIAESAPRDKDTITRLAACLLQRPIGSEASA